MFASCDRRKQQRILGKVIFKTNSFQAEHVKCKNGSDNNYNNKNYFTVRIEALPVMHVKLWHVDTAASSAGHM